VLEDAARARSQEANCLAKEGYPCGALYLAGYVVECRLKELLNKMGKPFPKSGPLGTTSSAFGMPRDYCIRT
jgi:hypothetical protein